MTSSEGPSAPLSAPGAASSLAALGNSLFGGAGRLSALPPSRRSSRSSPSRRRSRRRARRRRAGRQDRGEARGGAHRRHVIETERQTGTPRAPASIRQIGCAAASKQEESEMAERAALVTGASSGIGLAIARTLGEEGYALTVSARRPEKLEEAAAGLRADGFEVQTVAANMTEEDDVARGLRRPPRRATAASTRWSTTPGSGSARRWRRSRPSTSTCSSRSTCGR